MNTLKIVKRFEHSHQAPKTSLNITSWELVMRTSENCKLNLQWDTTTHLLIGQDVEQLEVFIHWWWKTQNAKIILKNALVVSWKIKHVPPIWSSNWSHGHLSERNENLCLQTILYTEVDSNLIYMWQKLETNKMYFVGRMI